MSLPSGEGRHSFKDRIRTAFSRPNRSEEPAGDFSCHDLGSLQETLLLPLWGRAVEARKPNPRLVDATAVHVMATIDYDFSTIARNIRFITQLAWISRSLHVDRTISAFLARYPEGAVVNLGCGLDTTFDRVDNGSVRWYDLDLPDVIDLRSSYIPERERSTVLPFNIFDTAWSQRIDTSGEILFVASGLFYYFEERQVRTFLTELAQTFPGAELIFDACSPVGLRVANRKVIRAGGMDSSALLKWSVRNVRDLEKWDRHTTVVAEYPVFHGVKSGFTLKEKLGTSLSDALRAMFMVHLRFAPPAR